MQRETLNRMRWNEHEQQWAPAVRHVGPWDPRKQPRRRLVYIKIFQGDQVRTKVDCDWAEGTSR